MKNKQKSNSAYCVLVTQLLAKDEIFRRKLQTLLCQLLISNPYDITFHAEVVPALELSFFKSCLAYCALGTQLCWGPFKYYVSKEVGAGWGQKMAIFADLQYYLC